MAVVPVFENAFSMIAICWFALRLLLPVAGAPLAGRAITSHFTSVKFMAMYVHAPMFSGSSCTQMWRSAFAYFVDHRPHLLSGQGMQLLYAHQRRIRDPVLFAMLGKVVVDLTLCEDHGAHLLRVRLRIVDQFLETTVHQIDPACLHSVGGAAGSSA